MVFNPFKNREEVEWTNTWIEACDHPDKKRALFIGDSVTREIRSEMSKLYTDFAFDYIGTSSSFDDPCFYNIFDAFFSNNLYKYKLVFINIGAKHCWYIHTAKNRKAASDYKKSFKNFIKYMKDHVAGAKIFILDTPPNRLKDNCSIWDETTNDEIFKRNKIQHSIAKDFGISVICLWDFVISKQYVYRDHCHFLNREASGEISRYIASFCSEMKLSECKSKANQINECNTLKSENNKLSYKLFGFIPLLSIEEK